MFKRKRKAQTPEIGQVPGHVAIIMDGNGRWAKKRLQPRVMGHKAGMDALQAVTIAASDLGVKVLTVYAFSTENWSRPKDEVSFIMQLPVDFFNTYVPKLHENNVRVEMMGDRTPLPQATLDALDRACDLTKENTGLILNFALNYGGRDDITKAVQQIVAEGIAPEEITAQTVQAHLMTAQLPATIQDPDLIIRTSGEFRLSNFLLWQSAYSEFYITDTLWPDFGAEELRTAIASFGQRDRRFGGLK